MSRYRCYFHSPIRSGEWEIISSDSDSEARRKIIELIRDRADVEVVDVWRGADFVFRLHHLDLRIP